MTRPSMKRLSLLGHPKTEDPAWGWGEIPVA
ncbi:Uncharacterised protein [Enterobacter asburiae]|uniref:Uncharacterized protein n=1 Tax=Enterobacter asburiae TaxID=61645 RepID=A0A376FEK8_ENTAS|nr:Uncharacterised protein [Enterobacter asburiae]